VVVIRATQKVLRSLPPVTADCPPTTAALGDWYVNRLVVDRQPLLLMVSSLSRLAIIEPARDTRDLPARLSTIVENRLRRLGVSETLISGEVDATRRVAVGKTLDRSVLGQLVDFAKAVPFYLTVQSWGPADLRRAEDLLGETPCCVTKSSNGVIWPTRLAVELLEQRWSVAGTLH
jgi:hypothetical protein